MKGLIGHTGFVGGNIERQMPELSAKFNSQNIESIRGCSFSQVYCAGAPGVKWLANREPEKDWAAISRMMECLSTAKIQKLILISTVDVYPDPNLTDEDFEIPEENHPYGKHRLLLEKFVSSNFSSLIVRLPALFGPGLKKNAVFDLLNNKQDLIHQDGVFQFYNIEHLTDDIDAALGHDISLLNIAVEPVGVKEMAREVFDIEFDNKLPPPAPRYDFRTKYAQLWDQSHGYLYDKSTVLAEMREFADKTKQSMRR